MLDNAQVALCILLKCINFSKFVYIIRTCPPNYIDGCCVQFDSMRTNVLREFIGADLPQKAIDQAALPLSMGGLGLRSTRDHSPAAFISSFNGVLPFLSKILSPMSSSTLSAESTLANSKLMLCRVVGSPKIADGLMSSTSQKEISKEIDSFLYQSLITISTPSEQARLTCLQHSPQQLLFSVPLDPFEGFRLADDEVRFLIGSRLGLAIFCNDGDPCPLCSAPMDSLGYHMATCNFGGSTIRRHDALVKVVDEHCHQAAYNPKTEECCFPDTQHRADILLPHLGAETNSGGTVLDVTVVHPLQHSLVSRASTVPLHSCIVKEQAKCSKYVGLCDRQRLNFMPLVFEFFGSWGPAADGFFYKLSTAISRRFALKQSSVHLSLSRKLSICLLRSNALAVFRRLPLLD
jgi:hypothetical protein